MTPTGVKYAHKNEKKVEKKKEKDDLVQKEGYIAGDKMEPYPGAPHSGLVVGGLRAPGTDINIRKEGKEKVQS